MFKKLMQLAGLVMLVATIVWLTREHLLPTPRVDDAPKPQYRSTPPSATPDDLTLVKGIGPVYASRLNEAGITTFAALAAIDPDVTAADIEVSGELIKDWIEQAKARLT